MRFRSLFDRRLLNHNYITYLNMLDNTRPGEALDSYTQLYRTRLACTLSRRAAIKTYIKLRYKLTLTIFPQT